MWVWVPILGKKFQTQLSEMERWWPMQYFVSSGIVGEEIWRTGGKSSGKNVLRNPLHNLLENLLNTWPVITVLIGPILGTKKIKDSLIKVQQIVESLWDTLGVVLQESLSCTLCCSRKKEMKDCKGITVSLAICPISHRDEDLLP